MTKRTRTVLFILCVFLFILAAPSIVFYSQGYRFDFNPPAGGKRVVQTGAFYFKALPKGAEVYLNGEPKQKTSILTGSVFVENLLPKAYEVEIKKEGYCFWRKKLEIKEKQVTEAKNIILFPENPNFTIVNQALPAVEAKATSSDAEKVVEADNYEIWVLFLKAQNEQPQRKAGERVFLTRFSEKIGHIFWLTDEYLIFSVGNKIKIAEIDDRDKINMVDLVEFSSVAKSYGGSSEAFGEGGKNPEMLWNQKEKKLYLLIGEKVYVSENLLP